MARKSPDAEGFRWDWRKSHELSWNQTISNAKLPASTKARVLAAIASKLRASESFSPPTQGQELKHLADTEIEMVDLDDRGPKEIVAQATGQFLCSPTGNCSTWILQPGPKGYRVILEGIAQTFTIQPTQTNGLHDLVLGMHASAFEVQLTVYKFDGNLYKNTACYDANWEVLGDAGDLHDLEEPRLRPCGMK